MSKKVFIIGSVSQEEEIKHISDIYISLGFEVNHSGITDFPFDILTEIKNSDLIVAIPEKNGTFCPDSIYKMMYASRDGKKVIINIRVGG